MKFFPIALFLICSLVASVATAQRISVTNSTCAGPNVCLPANQSSFLIERSSLTFDPDDNDAKRRFQAFWVTGDGNYLLFKPEDDALSMAPTYNYSTTGTFQTSAYLTGKYTDRKPPARAVINVPVGSLPEGARATTFSSRLGKLGLGTTPIVDVFSNHAIRRKYLTTFVLSWPANVQATGVYFFYNGYQNHTTRAQRRLNNNLIRFSNADVPKYFEGRMNAAEIKATSVLSLRAGGIPGVNFDLNYVNSLYEKYADVLYFPAETATQSEMPPGFTENRYFPVMWTDSLLVPDDTLLNFYVLITSNAPISSGTPTFTNLDSMIRRINPDLSPFTPFAFTASASGQDQPQYIQAVAEYQLPYLATFDPNQLIVENVQKIGEDEYDVSFRLEMCNKGRGDVFTETVDIFFSNDFHGLQPLDFTPENAVMGTDIWSFKVNKTILGVDVLPDGQHEESNCESIRFKAKTNCSGLRSLWKGTEASGVSSCVVFDGAISAVPECHEVMRIDSFQYQENGKCYCCLGGPIPRPLDVEGFCNGQLLFFLLAAIIALILLWWVFKRNS